MRKKVSVSVAAAITLIAMTVTFSITMIVSMNIFDATVNDVMEKQSFYNKISELDTYVRANYFGDIDDDTLNDQVARGFITGLDDPYSTYYTAAEYALLQDIEAGRVVGIGVVGQKDVATGYFRVIKVYAGSPAAAAGLTEGVFITEVDGVSTKNMASGAYLTAALRGGQGTQVTLLCETLSGEEQSFDIQRVNYTNPTVESSIVDGFAYIRIYSFTAETASDFDFLVREAEAAGVVGFVFDLRGTTYGHVENAYDMINLLCPLGNIAREVRKDGVVRSLRVSDEERVINLPMVCLVNANTAGAAELFAACLQDLGGGQVVGVRTAGKGSLQRTQQLQDGSAISITYALLYAGNADESFDGVGILPDLEVVSDLEDDRPLYNPDFVADTQLRRAMELARYEARSLGLLTQTEEPAEQPGGDGNEGEEPDSQPTEPAEPQEPQPEE